MTHTSLARELFQLVWRSRPVPTLNAETWQNLLALADQTALTLQLSGLPLPRRVEQQVEERWASNAIRRRRTQEQFLELADEFNARRIQWVLLKGITHETGFGLRHGNRLQSDLDFLVSPYECEAACEVLRDLGYRPHGKASLSAEHDRPWVRPFTWSWRGDYFDPEMPIPVELHHSVWSEEGDRLRCPGLEDFWTRRAPMSPSVQAFVEVDRIAFAALHALRHILRNDARPAHVFELARLLETRVDHKDLWSQWAIAHHPDVRKLQVIAFRFAEEWFGCRLPQAVARECDRLPSPVNSWLKTFSWSPVENLTKPNKDVLWLHLALLTSSRDRWHVARNRLFPLRLPHEPASARLQYHASALAPALKDGLVWWWRRTTSSTVSQTSD